MSPSLHFDCSSSGLSTQAVWYSSSSLLPAFSGRLRIEHLSELKMESGKPGVDLERSSVVLNRFCGVPVLCQFVRHRLVQVSRIRRYDRQAEQRLGSEI